MAKVFIFSDLHMPYTNLNKLTEAYLHLEREKPTHVIQIGDALDFYSFSKFPKSMNIMTPKQEITQGCEMLFEFWKIVEKISPKSKKIQLTGNHESRITKRISEKIPEIESLFDIRSLLTFKNVTTLIEESIEIDDVLYLHGFLTKEYAHMRYFLKSCVFGHTHHAWILNEKIHGKKLFEMTVGYLANDKLIPMQYTASKINKWTEGIGIVEDGVPRFIPL